MNHLLRELAPLTGGEWTAIDEEAKRTLKINLAARRLVDFCGPLGWQASSINLGRVEDIGAEIRSGVEVRRRRVQPLIELRAPLELSRAELDIISRGGGDSDRALFRGAGQPDRQECRGRGEGLQGRQP